jgi:hypothetical protein
MQQVIKDKFEGYPENAQTALKRLRDLILDVAKALEIGDIEESLKWGEPCYSVKTGSPIRMDWKLKTPNHYYLYFNCQTKLVDTYRELYAGTLECQGSRAIVFNLSDPLPEIEVRHCIELALRYKKIKHLPLLGV